MRTRSRMRVRACMCVRACVRALNGTINLLCRRGDCRGRRKLFGAIECELRYCAPESNPARSIRSDALFSFCACITPRRTIGLRDVAGGGHRWLINPPRNEIYIGMSDWDLDTLGSLNFYLEVRNTLKDGALGLINLSLLHKFVGTRNRRTPTRISHRKTL